MGKSEGGELAEIRENGFAARDVKISGSVEEVDLGIDVPENVFCGGTMAHGQ